MKNIALILLLLVYASLFAQDPESKKKNIDKDYEKFKNEVFDKEFGDDFQAVELNVSAGDDSLVRNYFPSVDLPGWFCLPSGNPFSGTAFGISDPGLDSATAFRQAKLRALANLALSRHCKVEIISDDFYSILEGRRQHSKFSSFSSIMATASYFDSLMVVENIVETTNNEIILSLRAQPFAFSDSGSSRIRCSIGFYQSERGKGSRAVFESRLSYTIQSRNLSDSSRSNMAWQAYQNAYGIEINSVMDQKMLPLQNGIFTYNSADTISPADADTTLQARTELKYGLWHGYLKAMLNEIEKMDVFNALVKKMDDDFSAKYQDITRVSSSNEISFLLSGLRVRDNKLCIEIQKH